MNSKFNIVLCALCCALIVSTSLVSCGSMASKDGTLSEAVDSLKGRKALVLYFSRSGENYIVGKVDKGNTAFLAEHIAEATGADICEIQSEKPYSTYSYEQMLNTILAEKENNEQTGYKADLPDASKYDVVFIGGPIWWGTYPGLMFSLFKDYNLDGKTIVAFTTNEGSGMGHTVADLKKAYPNAKVLSGFTMTGHEARQPEARQTVRDWLKSFSYDTKEEALDVDATTGATPMAKELTAEGKRSEITKTETVTVTHQNGTDERIQLVTQGAVDMGDGLLWSAVNLGADTPWQVGNHYAWGEAAPKESYTEDNYNWQGKEVGKDIGGTWYDAATQALGGDWRLPTYEEWHSLIVNCKPEYLKVNGQTGSLFTAKNGNRLFFPANGYKYGTEVYTPHEGFYWSSTNSSTDNAYVTYLPENSFGQSNYAKPTGIGVRAVKRNK